MNPSVVAHEFLTRDSRVVLPRVGVGVGVGLGEACISSHWQHSRPVENADATSTTAAPMHALREIGGGW